MTDRQSFDCIVVGGGPTGLAAAAALASSGLAVVLASEQPAGTGAPAASSETRTAALFPPSIAMLEMLGAWAGLRAACAPISAIRLVDGSRHLLRAPEVVFRAADIGRPDLGCNVPNADLAAALEHAAARHGVEILHDSRVEHVELWDTAARVTTSRSRTLQARLIIAADGRNSPTRDAAGIAARRTPCGQRAIATSFHHGRPHGGVSTEIHTETGPCTTVPMNGSRSSLVWMHTPDEARQLIALSPDAFLDRLADRLGGLLGTVTDLGPRRDFELVGLIAESMARSRVALVGEAAHAFPPIGAQGLNLGLADVAVLADLVGAATRRGDDPGAPALLAAYDRARHGEVTRRAGAVDLLNRSLQPGIWPLGLARGAGLHILAAMPSLRRRLMLEGLYPPPPLPSLMREDGASQASARAGSY